MVASDEILVWELAFLSRRRLVVSWREGKQTCCNKCWDDVFSYPTPSKLSLFVLSLFILMFNLNRSSLRLKFEGSSNEESEEWSLDIGIFGLFWKLLEVKNCLGKRGCVFGQSSTNKKFTAGAREFSKMVVVLKECPRPLSFFLNYPKCGEK